MEAIETKNGLPVYDLTALPQPERISEDERAYHADVIARFKASRSAWESWSGYLGRRYRIAAGDEIREDGAIIRVSGHSEAPPAVPEHAEPKGERGTDQGQQGEQVGGRRGRAEGQGERQRGSGGEPAEHGTDQDDGEQRAHGYSPLT